MTPMRAIVAATAHGAGAAFRSHDLGTIEKAKVADVVLLEADPLIDIHNIENIAVVIAQGRKVDLGALPAHPIFSRSRSSRSESEDVTHVTFLNSAPPHFVHPPSIYSVEWRESRIDLDVGI
jgi:Amidohydrolase family